MVPLASIVWIGGAGEAVKQQLGLVLEEVFQSSADIMERVGDNSYVELSELLLEKIQRASLFPDGKKKEGSTNREIWQLGSGFGIVYIARLYLQKTQALPVASSSL